MSHMRNKIIYWFLIGVSLGCGIALYLTKSSQVVGFGWLAKVIPDIVPMLQSIIPNWFSNFAKITWVSNHFADILWAFVSSMLVARIWLGSVHWFSLLLLCVTCAIFYESLQFFELTSGTFDWLDIFYSVLAACFGVLVTGFLERKLTTKIESQKAQSIVELHDDK